MEIQQKENEILAAYIHHFKTEAEGITLIMTLSPFASL